MGQFDKALPCDSDHNASDTWNGWLTDYNAGLVLSQQFAAVQLVLIFSTFSSRLRFFLTFGSNRNGSVRAALCALMFNVLSCVCIFSALCILINN